MSIGSVGGRTDNDVSDVTISSSTVSDSANGIRIKTVSGATGTVKGVTFKDITLSGSEYPTSPHRIPNRKGEEF